MNATTRAGHDLDRAFAIRQASEPRDVDHARALFNEYAASLDVDLCFQGFERELAMLPGAYAPPRGRLLLAGPADDPFGCIALRPLPADGDDAMRSNVAEVKRLYVQPRARGRSAGRRLAIALIDEARSIGYATLKLDTLPSMATAYALYESLGFVRCEPYYDTPVGGTVYLSLDLRRPGEPRR